MFRAWLALTALSAGCVAGEAAEPAAPPPLTVNVRAMDAHLRFLAHDLLEGRAPGTRGGHLTELYLESQFRALGLEPGGDEGTYFQRVGLVGMTPRPTLVWGPRSAPRTLTYLDEFVAWAERPEQTIVADGELVFVGHGIAAPEWRWDDYKNQVLRGKILVMLVNDPGLRDSTVFGGRVLTYYGRWTYKIEEAARRGAAGLILIHTDESATYPWAVVRNSWSGEQFKLDQPRQPNLPFAGWVTHDVAQAAFQRAGWSLDSLVGAAFRRDFFPAAIGLHAVVQVESTLRRVTAHNVLGRLPGTDANPAAQTVLLTGHWDHMGTGPVVNGDSIYNGAEDNASGVAALLGAAQALTRAPRARGSITFLATAAEESGLLGAEAYVQNPLVPLHATAAVLNLDVMNVRGATRDIGALGVDRSTLGSVFSDAARAESLMVRSEADVRGMFFRSDHFPFAKAGVPALSLKPGLEFVGRPQGWGREQDSIWNARRYHQPADEYSAEFDLAGMVQQVRVVARVALAVANAPKLPAWLPESEFQRPAGER